MLPMMIIWDVILILFDDSLSDLHSLHSALSACVWILESKFDLKSILFSRCCLLGDAGFDRWVKDELQLNSLYYLEDAMIRQTLIG
jgi:hypothetical protein